MVCTRCRVDVDMAHGFTSGKGRPALRMIIFGLIRFLSKKNNQTEFFLKKSQNRFKPTDFSSVCFLEQIPVQTGLALFFYFSSVFSGFFVWVRFGSVFFILAL